eukprot:g3070.t1
MSVTAIAARVSELKKEEWEDRAAGLKKLSSCPPASFTAETLRPLRAMYEDCLRDLRSNVVREACCSIKFLAESGSPVVKPLARDILPTLSAVRGSGNKVNSAYVHAATRLLITHVPLRSHVVHILHMLKTSKSKDVRESAAEYLYLALAHGDKDHLERGKEQLVPLVQSSLPALLALPSPRSREWARAAYWQFQQKWPTAAAAARQLADPRAQKLLGDTPIPPPEAEPGLELIGKDLKPQAGPSRKRKPLGKLAVNPGNQLDGDAGDKAAQKPHRPPAAAADQDGGLGAKVAELEAELQSRAKLVMAKDEELSQQEESMRQRIEELEAEVEEERRKSATGTEPNRAPTTVDS